MASSLPVTEVDIKQQGEAAISSSSRRLSSTVVKPVVAEEEDARSMDSTQEETEDNEEENIDFTDDEEDDDDDDSEGEEEEEEEEELDCKDLLERAQDRLARQSLQEEVEKLKETLERKNTEMEMLAGQLRRAIATKNELLGAHVDVERVHEGQMQQKDSDVHELRRYNVQIIEEYSKKEKELLNELLRLTDTMAENEKRHQFEREDMIRRHNNAMLEKDFEIAKLTVQLEVANMKIDTGSLDGSGSVHTNSSNRKQRRRGKRRASIQTSGEEATPST